MKKKNYQYVANENVTSAKIIDLTDKIGDMNIKKSANFKIIDTLPDFFIKSLESYIQVAVAGKSNHENESGDEIMDKSSGIDRLIEKMDRDLRDHKQEVRDRDARIQAEMQERENRIHQEAKEREERLLREYTLMRQDFKDSMKDVVESVNRAEQNINATRLHIQTLSSQNFWGRMATLLAIIAVAASLFFSVYQVVHQPSSQPASTTTETKNSIKSTNP